MTMTAAPPTASAAYNASGCRKCHVMMCPRPPSERRVARVSLVGIFRAFPNIVRIRMKSWAVNTVLAQESDVMATEHN